MRRVPVIVFVAVVFVALVLGVSARQDATPVAGTPGTPGTPRSAPTHILVTTVVRPTVTVSQSTPTHSVTWGCSDQGNLIACAQQISTVRTMQGLYPTVTPIP